MTDTNPIADATAAAAEGIASAVATDVKNEAVAVASDVATDVKTDVKTEVAKVEPEAKAEVIAIDTAVKDDAAKGKSLLESAEDHVAEFILSVEARVKALEAAIEKRLGIKTNA